MIPSEYFAITASWFSVGMGLWVSVYLTNRIWQGFKALIDG